MWSSLLVSLSVGRRNLYPPTNTAMTKRPPGRQVVKAMRAESGPTLGEPVGRRVGRRFQASTLDLRATEAAQAGMP